MGSLNQRCKKIRMFNSLKNHAIFGFLIGNLLYTLRNPLHNSMAISEFA